MRRYFPDLEQFKTVAKNADVIPVYRQLLADRLTPVSAFEVLGREPHAFLLESVVGGERIARYSFIAAGPSLVYQVTSGKAKIDEPVTHRMRTGKTGSFDTTDPLADLAALMPRRRYHHDGKLPAFTGGLVGYAGYDTIRYYEGEKLPEPPKDDRRLPDLLFGLYNELVVFDHVDKTIKVVANADVTAHDGDTEAAYRDACRRTDEIVQRLQQPPTSKLGEIDATA
jgi:anthranilate synthase component 1